MQALSNNAIWPYCQGSDLLCAAACFLADKECVMIRTTLVLSICPGLKINSILPNDAFIVIGTCRAIACESSEGIGREMALNNDWVAELRRENA